MKIHIKKLVALSLLMTMTLGLTSFVNFASANQSYRYSSSDFDVSLSYRLENVTYSIDGGSDVVDGSETFYVELTPSNDVGFKKINDASYSGDTETDPVLISTIDSYDISDDNAEFIDDLSDSSLEDVYSDRVYEFVFEDVSDNFEKGLKKEIASDTGASASEIEISDYNVLSVILITGLSSDLAGNIAESIDDGESENNDNDFTKGSPLVTSGLIVGESSILSGRFSPTKFFSKVSDVDVDALRIDTKNDLLASEIEFTDAEQDVVYTNTTIDQTDYTYGIESRSLLLEGTQVADSDVIKYFGVSKKGLSLRGTGLIIVGLFFLMILIRFIMVNYSFNTKYITGR